MATEAPRLTGTRSEISRRLTRLIEGAAGQIPAVAVVQGPALSGKTHIAAEAAAIARRQSFTVAEVDARQSSLSFFAVDRLTRQLGVRSEGQTDDLARLHGLRLACQRSSAGRGGVAIIVDNAEFLAPGDAEVLHDLMASPPVGAFFCLLTAGGSAAARRTAGNLIGNLGLQRVRPEWFQLDALEDDEVAPIAEQLLQPGLLTYRFVRDVRTLADGIMGRIVQILQAVEDLPAQERADVMTGSEFVDRAIVPGPLVDDLMAPLLTLDAVPLAVARALAVQREPTTTTTLAELLGREPAEVESALGLLEDRRIVRITLTPADEASAWFVTTMLAIAIRRSLPLLTSRALHNRAAMVRERTIPPDTADPILVVQYLNGSLPLTAVRIDTIVTTAHHFVSRSRYATARRVLESMIARGSADPANPLPPSAFTVLSEALLRSGATIEAGRLLDAVASAEQPAGSAADTMIRQVRTAVALGHEALAANILEAGLTREDLDAPTRGRLMLELGRLVMSNDYERGRTLCDSAYEIGARIPDHRLQAEADITVHASYLHAGQPQHALAHCRRALISSMRLETPGATKARAFSGIGRALMDTISVERGLHWLHRAQREAEIADDLATSSWASQVIAEACIEMALWDEAAHWIAHAVRLDANLHRDRSLTRSRSLDARLRALRGNMDPAWADETTFPRGTEWTDGPSVNGPIYLAHAEHAVLAGRAREAHTMLRETLARHRGSMLHGRTITVDLLPAAVSIAYALGDTIATRDAAHELGELAGQLGDELIVAPVLHRFARAQLAALDGDWREAAREASTAGTELTDLGYRWRGANAFALAGEAYVQLKEPEAEDFLTRAFRTYRSIGAPPRLTAVRDLLHEIGSRAPRPRDPSQVLTARQWQIAQLAGDGKTDAAIGEALTISRRTVTTHMHHILRRLELASRTQLAEWFRDHPAVRA